MLNIAYTFKPEDEVKLSRVSSRLNNCFSSEYRLGDNSIAHISMTHIEGEVSDADMMWRELSQSAVDMELDVVLKCFVVKAPWKERVYTEFALERVGELSKIQKNIMRIFNGREVFNGCGADFNPHITLSCHLEPLKVNKLTAQKAPFKRVKAYLTIGTRDSYGRMEKILYGGYKV